MTRFVDDYSLVVHGEDSIDAVISGILIGNMHSATQWKALHARCVTHILCMTAYKNSDAQCRPREFQYKCIEAGDYPEYDIAQHFDDICAFIGTAIDGGGVVYVHCMHGITRAATAVVIFLMRSCDMRFCDALALLRRARPIVELNTGFWRALQQEENIRQNHALVKDNNVFSRIIRREVSSDIVYENSELLIFNNIHPASTTHMLVISKTTPVIFDVSVLTQAHIPLLMRMINTTERVLRCTQPHAMHQFLVGFHVPPFISVPHLHMHVILKNGRFVDADERYNHSNFLQIQTVLCVLANSTGCHYTQNTALRSYIRNHM